MPTLNWIGKDKVINHHLDVPYRVLDLRYTFSAGNGEITNTESENKIIRGDNLEALKALLPQYEGKIKCIYIDPPYNTGNENWVYNDNVNDPKFRKWLGQVVGKEGEDLSRHDKWLCMMYPRLRLLQRLLADDGIIFISIDENEHRYLELLMDEVFGSANRIETIIWQNNYGGGSKTKHIVHIHEYILCFAKNAAMIGEITLPPNDAVLKYYKYRDEKFDTRGPFRLQPLATTSMDSRPNLRYPLYFEGNEIWPEKQWFWSQERAIEAQNNNNLVFSSKKGKWSVNYKQYLVDESGESRGSKPYSIVTGIYTQQGTKEIKSLLGTGKAFDFPKPPDLISYLLSMVADKDAIILDSFAGSGTTAHAVLKMNQQDGGNRQFILVEMEDYAETTTAERVRRVMQGYGEGNGAVPGTGGDFSFYDLGEPLLIGDMLNPNVPTRRVREYVYFMETKTPMREDSKHEPYLLGVHQNTAYYFVFEPHRITVLDDAMLSSIQTHAEEYVIYADRCALGQEEMGRLHITFKKIPRDITRL